MKFWWSQHQFFHELIWFSSCSGDLGKNKLLSVNQCDQKYFAPPPKNPGSTPDLYENWVHEKVNRGELPKIGGGAGGAGTFCRLRGGGGHGKKEGMFLFFLGGGGGGVIPQCTLWKKHKIQDSYLKKDITHLSITADICNCFLFKHESILAKDSVNKILKNKNQAIT